MANASNDLSCKSQGDSKVTPLLICPVLAASMFLWIYLATGEVKTSVEATLSDARITHPRFVSRSNYLKASGSSTSGSEAGGFPASSADLDGPTTGRSATPLTLGSSTPAQSQPPKLDDRFQRLLFGLLGMFAVLGAMLGGLAQLFKKSDSAVQRNAQYGTVATAGAIATDVETLVPSGVKGMEGMYCAPNSAVAQRVLRAVPGLSTWANWYEAPLWARNGHVHTIVASQTRQTPAVSYHRTFLQCPLGGTVTLDELVEIHPVRAKAGEGSVTFVPAPSEDWTSQKTDKPFLLMVSGLGGGSNDAYVRSMAVSAMQRGWRAAIVNMRGCGGSPITTPRFFSAYRGSTDDVRMAVAHIRQNLLQPGGHVAAIGWSNGGTVVNNLLAEQATTHQDPIYQVDAAATLGCPLNMPLASQNFKRWFHKNIYDRAITNSLVSKLTPALHLFDGQQVDTWDGGKCTIDVGELAKASTIEEIDEHLTRKVFGFPSVDAYYRHASSDQRLKDIQVPTLIINALDDPVAPGEGIAYDEVLKNENLILAVTAHGGHLGWCEKSDPTDGSKWIEKVSLDFLEAVLDLQPQQAP